MYTNDLGFRELNLYSTITLVYYGGINCIAYAPIDYITRIWAFATLRFAIYITSNTIGIYNFALYGSFLYGKDICGINNNISWNVLAALSSTGATICYLYGISNN